jgi:hypothetical protein
MSHAPTSKQASKPAHPSHPEKTPAKSQRKRKDVVPDDDKPEKEDESASTDTKDDAAQGDRNPAPVAGRNAIDAVDEEGAHFD